MQLTKPITLPKPTLGSLGALRRKKSGGSLAGLSIEAGSVAVAEVAANGSTRLTASAVQPLQPGVFHEGEVIDPSGLTAAIKDLYSRNKLPKQVRLGIG